MKICKDCANKGKKENCKIYTSVSNFAENCKDFQESEKRMLITNLIVMKSVYLVGTRTVAQ